ncbi:DNA-formamidopyrimidine glycosylase, partial [Candidatus Peregrinibacteria bacterium]|nr:DNA-formamidopyrimidine glycosylase [Candidatus Peregrinibacteria bacterium]
MPELPEVQTVVSEIGPELQGQKLWKFESKNAVTFVPNVDEFERILPGQRIENVERRGKYIVMVLSNGFRMIIHLRMTGMLSFEKIKGKEKFIRGIFTFTSVKRLYFSDIRKFGKIYLFSEKDYLEKSGMYKLGRDPFVDDFSLDFLESQFLGRKGILKNRLLDQTVIAGIGNIYADEI